MFPRWGATVLRCQQGGADGIMPAHKAGDPGSYLDPCVNFFVKLTI